MSSKLTLYDAAEKYGIKSMSVNPAITKYNETLIGEEISTSYSWGSGQLLPGQSGSISVNTSGGFTREIGITYSGVGENIFIKYLSLKRTDTGEVLSYDPGWKSATISNIDIELQPENLYEGIDFITGNSYGNYLAGFSGDDRIDGGAGIDTSILRCFSDSCQIKVYRSFTTTNSPDGFDAHVNIERLNFYDLNIALDISPTQNAGSVYMLYKAAFNRPSDAGGMGYWIAQRDGGANIVTSIAQGFVNSAEFIAKYGANPSNSSYVNNLYQNVLGRAGEAGGVAYWTGEMDAGRVSKAQALVSFATLPEGASIVAPLIANGIQYQEWIG